MQGTPGLSDNLIWPSIAEAHFNRASIGPHDRPQLMLPGHADDVQRPTRIQRPSLVGPEEKVQFWIAGRSSLGDVWPHLHAPRRTSLKRNDISIPGAKRETGTAAEEPLQVVATATWSATRATRIAAARGAGSRQGLR
ncbi:hypothetical protein N7492_002530 [Penicillium capsulatum]|uniref:Uncharacterized protein n=1 Tax=Penicillium capsulatum TaxID=69766 RepID=A0A9W9LVS4_9EURO|nr:hypothetical protein N7492_002530 [Penicillium capsulatum]KAJ6122866.1 hypothetical protein N7512_005331 [Penicillium capsulatum]